MLPPLDPPLVVSPPGVGFRPWPLVTISGSGELFAMWEDNKTRSKWVFVNRSYFPNDLPEADGRPCSPESDEVYESNHGNTIVAGLIRGPCVVLPPSKFNEESGRRSRLGPGANDGLQPLYLCNDFICFNGVSSVLIMRHHNSEAIHASEYESLTSLTEIVLLSGELRRIR
ncbi:hypothetical protein RHGRI_017359 [Rhododendron griersonianum]|uniref:C2H2-type domain-containing protein n=1 Tax=Rhododendron griersonianum TaxID=479676 RepID=A0AAV6JXJ0_9ERIC|nr:hypothetical protein RHGRI_017359 [Rhododendron griersonianum]